MTIAFQFSFAISLVALLTEIQVDLARAFSSQTSMKVMAAGNTRLFSSAGVDQKPPGGVIFSEDDEASLLEAYEFPISPEELIENCKRVIIAQRDVQDAENFDDSIFADDFKLS